MRNSILSIIVFFTVLGCSSTSEPATPAPPAVTSGTIIEIVKHDDVEKKKKICVAHKTTKKNGKTTKSCSRYQTKTVEVTPEWYEFKLQNGNRIGWTGRLDETTGESYKEGDQYP